MKRRIMKEGKYRTKGWMLNDALERAQKALFWLDQAAKTVRRVDGEDSEIFIRLDSSRNDVDDAIDDLKQRIDGMEDQEFGTSVSESRKRFGGRFVKESRGSKWFNEYGFLTKRIPSACIKACSGSGQKQDAIRTWVYNLQFFIPDNLLDQAIDYLREYGAYDENTLQKWKKTEDINHTIAQYVLWNFCCDVADGNLRQSELYLGH